MNTSVKKRFQSGDTCPEPGTYEFDGYVISLPGPLPGLGEMEVSVEAGGVFPSIESTQRECFWTPVEGVIQELAEVEAPKSV